MTYTLEMTDSILSSLPAFGTTINLANVAKRWRRSIRYIGGFWEGSFYLEGDNQELKQIFNDSLGAHLVERENNLRTWEGFVSKLRLENPDGYVVKDLSLMNNAVDAFYDLAGTDTPVGYAVTQESIDRYGRREFVVSGVADDIFIATAKRNTRLSGYGYPWPRRKSLTRRKGDARLTFTVLGYVHTLNWRYIDPNALVVPSTYNNIVNQVVSNFADFVNPLSITTNALQVTSTPDRVRAWDYISDLLEAGDGTGNQWRAYVDLIDEKVTGLPVFNYEPISTNPAYESRQDGLYKTGFTKAEITPRQTRPGIWRDLNYTVENVEPGSWLQDARDSFVAEVSVDEGGRVEPKTEELPEGDNLTALSRFELPYEDILTDDNLIRR